MCNIEIFYDVPQKYADRKDPMDQLDQNIEQPTPAPKPKKAHRPIRISLSVCILCMLLVGLAVFMTTYVTVSLEAERAINAAYGDAAKYDKLLEVAELYENYYFYDIDEEKTSDALASMYGAAVGDQYMSYYTKEEWEADYNASIGNATGIGVYVVMNEDGNILVTRVMDDGPAKKAGLMDGDIITAIDGTSVLSVGYENAVNLVIGERGTTVSFDVLRGKEEWKIDITRGAYDPQTVFAETVTVEGSLYGYLHIVQFERTTPTQFKKAVNALIEAGAEGLIFDVRDNPGGDLYAIIEILDFLLPEGPIVHLVGLDESDNETFTSDADEIDLPMVVLANENTASAAELFTSALKDYDKAMIVGQKTHGKGCGQEGMALSDGSVVFLTTFLYNPPYSENYDGIGIYPDYEIEIGKEWENTNLMLIPHEKDAQLDKAIEVLHELAN